jgi:hypothetical protein
MAFLVRCPSCKHPKRVDEQPDRPVWLVGAPRYRCVCGVLLSAMPPSEDGRPAYASESR